MPFKNKLDVLYFVVASFTWLLRASSKNRSYLRIKTTMIFCQVCCFDLQQGNIVIIIFLLPLGHISNKNKLDVLYFVVASFTWLLRASSKNRSYLHIKTTMIFRQVCCFNLPQRPGVVKLDSTEAGQTDTH